MELCKHNACYAAQLQHVSSPVLSQVAPRWTRRCSPLLARASAADSHGAQGSAGRSSATTTSTSSFQVASQEEPTSSVDQAQPLQPENTSLPPGLEEEEGPQFASSPLLASLSALGVCALIGGGFLFKDQIKGFLEFFIDAVDDWGAWGYAAYALVYTALEVLAVPAIPLTMTAGVIFGTLQGTLVVSLSGTVAATIAFLIARYAARDKVRSFAYRHPKFKAIDRVIGQNGLKFVTLLRLSPLLPLAASNYLYGLTSVDLGSYVLGSWIGMLPGTYAYVHAGSLGRAVLMEGEGALSIDAWHVGLGLGATLLALAFVGKLAKNAIDEVEEQQQAENASTTSSNSQNQQPNSKQ